MSCTVNGAPLAAAACADSAIVSVLPAITRLKVGAVTHLVNIASQRHLVRHATTAIKLIMSK